MHVHVFSTNYFGMAIRIFGILRNGATEPQSDKVNVGRG